MELISDQRLLIDNSDSDEDANQTTVDDSVAPLAARLRPRTLADFVGQEHLVGERKPVRRLIESDSLSSMILWGPPGSGKTTLAYVIANQTKSRFVKLSAVDSGKKDVKRVIDLAKASKDKRTILFLDEIHRFNKAQQDFLLPYVENGTLMLIGATTENPSFTVISALLSRCRVFVLKPHTPENLQVIEQRGVERLKKDMGLKTLALDDDAGEYLVEGSNGDPRTLLNALEMAVKLACSESPSEDARGKAGSSVQISKGLIEDALQHKALLYDRNGEEHYNIISALHKSLRSSDENAALYWLARMIEAGEDALYVARRMLRFAAEDIGNADPQAVILANAVFDACNKIGVPECNVHLAQLAIYLARAPKDNSAYTGYSAASEDARNTLNLPVPLHLRNAPTKLMKNLGYGKGYVYDHDVPGKLSGQQCLPDELVGRKYVNEPSD